MKYAGVLLLGLLLGAFLFVLGMVYFPWHDERGVSPLSVNDSAVLSLSYDAVARRSIAFTNDGESRVAPHPGGVPQLRDAAIEQSSVLLTVMRNARGQAAALGLQFSAPSEKTHLIAGKALVDSDWYIYLPGQGSLFIEQSQNYWPYLKSVVIPAYRNSANSWKGSWFGNLTAGPGAAGTAIVTAGSEELSGRRMAAVESLTVQAYSADTGLVAAEGRLLIEVPAADPQPGEAAE